MEETIIKGQKKKCPVCGKEFVCKRRGHESCSAKCRKINYNHKYPLRPLIDEARYRAKKAGIEFNITEKDLTLPETCPILGIQLYKSYDEVTANSYSIDRLDPTKGYIKGNCNIISYRANTIKGNATSKEHRQIADWIDSENNSTS